MSPEGYRKALRLMKTAENGLPVFTFVDTPAPILASPKSVGSPAIGRNILKWRS
jgi:acetyl-CoA carboxylase alpha subunit